MVLKKRKKTKKTNKQTKQKQNKTLLPYKHFKILITFKFMNRYVLFVDVRKAYKTSSRV